MSSDYASTTVIDIEALLYPISDDNPSGENQQYTGLYDEIREARRADEELVQGDWKRELKSADWREVLRLTTEALSSKTKDLQIGAWLSEAIIKMHGFYGLRDGLTLIRRLQEEFWDTLYPEEDEGDLEARANALSWLDRAAGLAIKEVPITSTAKGAYSYFRYEESKSFDVPDNLEALDSDAAERAAQAKSQAAAEGKITSEDWRNAKNASNRAFYEEISRVINESWEEFKKLDAVMDEKFERQTPGLGDLKKSLDTVRSFIELIVKEKRILEPDPKDIEETLNEIGEASEGGGGARGASATGPIGSRQEALRRLLELAEFFRKTEPHSPVPYLIQRAVKWGNMPLEMWLKEMIKDAGTLGGILETLGMGASDSYASESYSSESSSSESESSDW